MRSEGSISNCQKKNVKSSYLPRFLIDQEKKRFKIGDEFGKPFGEIVIYSALLSVAQDQKYGIQNENRTYYD